MPAVSPRFRDARALFVGPATCAIPRRHVFKQGKLRVSTDQRAGTWGFTCCVSDVRRLVSRHCVVIQRASCDMQHALLVSTLHTQTKQVKLRCDTAIFTHYSLSWTARMYSNIPHVSEQYTGLRVVQRPIFRPNCYDLLCSCISECLCRAGARM